MRLNHKVAIITGAAGRKSIGFGIARVLAREGAALLINDYAMPDELQQRAAELTRQGARVFPFLADVTCRAEVDAMVAAAVHQFGRVDILVSNAGLFAKQPFLEITPQAARRLLNVNLKGSFNVCQAAARQMIAQGQGGRIIVTSSVHSEMPFALTAHYGASKRALWSLVRSMAVEMACHDITVNQVEPGWVPTGIDGIDPEHLQASDLEKRLNSIPLGQPVLPIDLGEAVLYFAALEAGLVTGASLRVDGGQILCKY